ncbi:MFS transporter [Xylanimonas protaetiae]|uniref:MFS transporter n=1 Tax=Xylanimonas protaetiae TaxID=2509457 RepID=A0A4P6F7B3_9MICO|nr:MFS transporter [Xylanimonas protaetiae]QAY71584.1 MFS transporter [Xylanimonas protaetiae]
MSQALAQDEGSGALPGGSLPDEELPDEEPLAEVLEPGRRTGPVVAVLAATGIVVSLAQTLVVPIIASLPEIFRTDASNTSWIITVTLLVGAIATPVTGRLGDLYGKKKLLLVAIVPFIVGSVVCALSTTVGPMIVGRGLQGLGTGMIPLGISVLHDVLPKDKAGSAIALMSASMGIGGALGLPLAAAVSEYADWRVLFWATGAAAVLAFLAILFVLPVHDPRGHHRGFDHAGTLGLAVGLAALLLSVSKGAEWGWGSGLTVGGFVVAVVVLLAWGWYELRHRHPLVDLRTTVRPVVLLTNVASIFVGFAMYAMNLILPQVMEYPVELGFGLGQSMLGMGLWMAPTGLAMMAVSAPGARISRTRGPKVTLAVAGAVIAVGYGICALVLGTLGNRDLGPADSTTVLWTLVLLALGATVVGCGIGFAFGSMPALIMSSVPAHEKAAANGFNSLMRSLGTTSSAAVIAVVLAQLVQQVQGRTVPTVSGFIVSLAIGCGGALVALVLALAIPGNPGRGQSAGH